MRTVTLAILSCLIGLGLTACEGQPEAGGAQASVAPVPSPTSTDLAQGTGVGNGGGAIKRNGQVLTFGQAGVKIIEEKSERLIAGLPLALELTGKLALSEPARGKLFKALEPVGNRRYFHIDPRDLTPWKRNWLLKQYEATIGEQIPTGELTIVAVTVGSETYLLPEFDQLSDDIARAAILLHEALWVTNSKLPLATVVQTEIAAEKILRAGIADQDLIYDFDLMQILKKGLQDPYAGVVGATLADFRRGPVQIRVPTLDGVVTKTLPHPGDLAR